MKQKLVGLVAVVAAVTLAACGSSGGSSSETSGESEGPATTTITDLVVDQTTEPDSLDPFYRNTAETQRFYRLVYSSLLKWNEDASLSGDLAADLPEVSEDGKTLTIKLREGVTFHDGSPFTAEDVVFTYETVADKENGSVWLSGLSYMDSVTALDDFTVELKLTDSFAYIEGRMAMIPIMSSDTPYKPNDTYASSANGTGPYTLESQKRGDSITLARFDNYFGEQPPFETITLKTIPEDASRIARLTNGESHLLPDIPANQIELIQSRGANAKIVEGNAGRLFLYPSMNPDRPTSNADFRLALAYAADRQQMIDQVYDGAGRPNSTYLTYGTKFHDEALGLTFGSEPNIEKAKEYLAKSGYDTNRKFSIIANNVPSVVSAMTILQANLKEIGIEATVQAQDVAGFYDALISGDYDVIAFSSEVSTSTGFSPDYVYGGLHSTSANNFAFFKDPEMDRLLETAVTSRTDQAEAWKAVQEYDLLTQGNIHLVLAQKSEAWSKDLVGFEPSSLIWLNTVLDVK